jgi:Uma2 family endonuclease
MVTGILEIPALPSRSIVLNPPLSDEEFERLCARSESVFLERTKDGAILVNAPAGSSTSDGNREITTQLSNWWKKHRRGRAYDSSAGFFLPDGSMLNPDAAYATAEQLQGLTPEDRAHFLHLAPAFVIELRSPSDRLSNLSAKMDAWMANGVQVAWLIDPSARQVHIYEHALEPRIETGSSIAGSGPVDGFVLDIEEVWRCFE